MNSSYLRSLCFAGIWISVLPTPYSPAAEAAGKTSVETHPAVVERLVITKGVISDRGKPATIRNIIDRVSEIYPGANITVVDVDHVTIENLTLQYAKRWAPPDRAVVSASDLVTTKMPLEGIFTALVEASGRRFRVSNFGPDSYVLSPPDGGHKMPRVTEVFNLGSTRQSRMRAALEEDIRRAETEIGVLRADYGDKHPRIVEGITRINVLKAQLPPANAGRDSELLEQIKEVVTLSLKLKSGGEPPEFKFHAGSNLLVVVGSEDAIDITRKVIAALEKNP